MMNPLHIAQGELQTALQLTNEIIGLATCATEKSKLELMQTLLLDAYQQLDAAQRLGQGVLRRQHAHLV